MQTTCSADTTVTIWSISPNYEFKQERVLIGHQRWVWDCAFSADSAYLVTGSFQHPLIIRPGYGRCRLEILFGNTTDTTKLLSVVLYTMVHKTLVAFTGVIRLMSNFDNCFTISSAPRFRLYLSCTHNNNFIEIIVESPKKCQKELEKKRD